MRSLPGCPVKRPAEFRCKGKLVMPMFTADGSCVKCGLCAELCLTGIIFFENGQKPSVPAESEAACIGCGQCVAFCPQRSVHLSFQPEENRRLVEAALLPDADGAETFIRSRRSIRRYKDEPVDEGTVRRLIETTCYAPSAANGQPVRWVVTRDRRQTVKLADLVARAFEDLAQTQPEEPSAQLASRVAAAWNRGKDSIFRGAPQLAAALVDKNHRFPEDGAIALTYFELAVHGLGLGCCWAGFFTWAARLSPEIQKAVGVRENEIVCGGQMFGYPNGLAVAKVLPPRKNPDIIFI